MTAGRVLPLPLPLPPPLPRVVSLELRVNAEVPTCERRGLVIEGSVFMSTQALQVVTTVSTAARHSTTTLIMTFNLSIHSPLPGKPLLSMSTSPGNPASSSLPSLFPSDGNSDNT